MLFLLWDLGSGKCGDPHMLSPLLGDKLPERALSTFPSTPGSHAHALHFINLSFDSLTAASWQQPRPDGLRQNVQDTGPGLEQGVTGSWAGPLSASVQWSGAEGRMFPFQKVHPQAPLAPR